MTSQAASVTCVGLLSAPAVPCLAKRPGGADRAGLRCAGGEIKLWTGNDRLRCRRTGTPHHYRAVAAAVAAVTVAVVAVRHPIIATSGGRDGGYSAPGEPAGTARWEATCAGVRGF